MATLEELEEQFGHDVAKIVNGTTRITNVQYNSKLANQAENIRKLFLAISADIRVLLVKLTDRLQDMLTLGTTSPERQRQLARETLDLYAPLASRLGIDWMKRELEDLSFQYLYPVEYADVTGRLESTLGQRESYVDEVMGIIHQKLGENGVKPVRIIGRPKHLFSIYRKLIAQKIPLDKVYDKVAFRIILHSVKECYEALGTIHANWPPVPGRIKDFISVPKSNNYQSLHTTVVGPYDNFIEIQIRTEEMDNVAQEGVAAHWAYKEGQKIGSSDARLFRDLKKLVQSLQEVEDHREFLDSVRGELNEPDVYALTPNGEVRELPRGSTPIDFAYSIHTEVGDRCSGARVNNQLVSLKYKLQHGDIVEIITQKNQHPKRAWLQIVKTSRARNRIRQWLRREEKEKALHLGREICERELKKHNTTLKRLLKSGHMRAMLKELGCNSLEDLLAKVGSGDVTVHHLIQALSPGDLHQGEETQDVNWPLENVVNALPRHQDTGREVIDIDGVDGILVVDVPFGSDDEFRAEMRANGLCSIPLIAPTTPKARAKEILAEADGFVYYIMVCGVTGARTDVAGDIGAHINMLRDCTDLPIAVGFGVSNGEQASSAVKDADAVVVGSALIRAAREDALPALVREISAVL